MLKAFSDNLTGLIGSNQVLNACGWILSFINTKQFFQTEFAVTLIIKTSLLMVSY
jgi:hypothetical protein